MSEGAKEEKAETADVEPEVVGRTFNQEMSSQLVWITTQLSVINQFVQSVKNFGTLVLYCLYGAIMGYLVGKVLLMIIG